MTAACTIVSPNYLPFARTLAKSYRLHHPGSQFFVLLVANIRDASLFKTEPFTTVLIDELRLSAINSVAMKYDILELNTNLKPTFLKYLLATFKLDALLYLDPDISVYQPLIPALRSLESASAVLTPHITSPVPQDGKLPNEQDMLYNGTFNLGFIGIRNDEEGNDLLDWWEQRCLLLGFSEARTGLFVDQKWLNLAPGFYPRVKVIRELGCNMAYWNLHERTLTRSDCGNLVNDAEPLYFYHFSGVDVDDPAALSTHTNRFTLEARPDLQDLFRDYKERVRANRVPERDGLQYGFDRFTDGLFVNRLARRIYSKHAELQGESDPFDASGRFYKFCKRHGLLSRRSEPAKSTWKEFDPSDRRVLAVHKLLSIALKVLGPNRYELLMRYLGYISVLRNQALFIRD